MNMTHDEIMKLEAERELDALVAEHVMGQTDFKHPGFFWEEGMMEDGDGWDGFYCPRCKASEFDKVAKCAKRYSTDIAAAWQVVEKMRKLGFTDSHHSNSRNGPRWSFSDNTQSIWSVSSDSDPISICRAALFAVMDSGL